MSQTLHIKWQFFYLSALLVDSFKVPLKSLLLIRSQSADFLKLRVKISHSSEYVAKIAMTRLT